MNNENRPQGKTMSQEQALTYVRFFWFAFNNINMYGSSHPESLKGIERLYVHLKSLLDIVRPITLHLEGGSLICEEWKIEKEVNVQRLIERFEHAGINSITFTETIVEEDLVELFKVLINVRSFLDIKMIIDHFNQLDIKSIQFNYYTFQKISIDEVQSSRQKVTTAEPESSVEVAGDFVEPVFNIIGLEILKAVKSRDWEELKLEDIFNNAGLDLNEAEKLFPEIKAFLFEHGLSYLQYMQVLLKLNLEFQAKGIESSIKDNSDITVSKIVSEINKNPADIIPLVGVGIKLASMIGDSHEPIINAFFHYFESALINRILSTLTGTQIENDDDIKADLEKSKTELFNQMIKSGLTAEIITELEIRYNQRQSILVNLLQAQLLIDSTIDRKKFPDKQDLLSLAKEIKSRKAGKQILAQVIYLLGESGYSTDTLDHFIEHVTLDEEKVKPVEQKLKMKSFRLPSGIPNFKETKKYMDMEINRHLRYKTPLSYFSISVGSILTEVGIRNLEIHELENIFKEIAKILKKSLRNLDFIGSLGTLRDNHLIVILTMTDEEGMIHTLDRVKKELDTIRVEIEGESVIPGLIFIPKFFNSKETPDIRSFIRKVRAQHRKEIKKGIKD